MGADVKYFRFTAPGKCRLQIKHVQLRQSVQLGEPASFDKAFDLAKPGAIEVEPRLLRLLCSIDDEQKLDFLRQEKPNAESEVATGCTDVETPREMPFRKVYGTP